VAPGGRAQDESKEGSLSGHGLRLLSAIVENLPHMIFVKDAVDLRFVLFNRAGEELLGVPRGRMLGKSDFDLFPADQAEFFVTKDREVLTRGTLLDIPVEEILSPSQGERALHTKKVPILDDEGRPRYLLGISEDITDQLDAAKERNKLARQLELAQTMGTIGRLAAGIAHDFNNVLLVIMASGQYLLDDKSRAEPDREALEDIIKSAQRGADLTRKLLAFGRRQALELGPVDVNAVVENIEWLLRRLIGDEIKLHVVLDHGAGTVRADLGQMERVAANLAVNARDAMPNGGTLTFATASVTMDIDDLRSHDGATPGRYVQLSVTDTGTGMSADVVQHIFEPGFTTKEVGRGTGLGLATVSDIVRETGGFVAVESEPGHGTTFRVYLPSISSEQ
jgi:PAS domain S-box-containing protein